MTIRELYDYIRKYKLYDIDAKVYINGLDIVSVCFDGNVLQIETMKECDYEVVEETSEEN